MRNSFGTFKTLQGEMDFMRYVFWNILEYQVADEKLRKPKFKSLLIDGGDQIIIDLSREPFQAYLNALKLNGVTFHHRSYGYPASETYFINPESVKVFHNALLLWQRKYNLLNICSSKETDWIPAKACNFFWHWSEFPIDYENLFLANSGSTTGFIDENVPKGFDEFAAHFETPEIYAERMAVKAKDKISSDEMLSNLPKPDQRRFIESAKKVALKHAKDFQQSKLSEHPNLSRAKELPSLLRHFVWLIKTYILGQRFTDISRENEIEVDIAGISRNVNRLAKILGLPKPAHLRRGNPNLTSKP